MATLYSKTTGNWTTLGTFNTLANGSGTDTAPTNADDCIIQNTHTVTIDATTPVCKSCTVQAGGKLKASTTASSKLVCQDTIYRSGSGIFEFDVSGDATITCTLLVNNANNALGTATQIDLAPATAFTFKGASRKRWTTITSGVSAGGSTATAADASGWRQGDVIVFATTQAYNATPKVDVMTLSGSYTNGSTSLDFTGTFANDHASGCLIGNLSSNMILAPGNAGAIATDGRSFCMKYDRGATASSTTKVIQDVQIQGLNGGYTNNPAYGLALIDSGGTTPIVDTSLITINNNAFYDFRSSNGSSIGGALFFYQFSGPTAPRTNNIFYTANGGSAQVGFNGAITTRNASIIIGPDVTSVVFRAPQGVCFQSPGYSFSGHISGIASGGYAIDDQSAGAVDLSDTSIWSCNKGINANGAIMTGSGVNVGTSFSATVVTPFNYAALGQITFTDSNMQAGTITPTTAAYTSSESFLKLVNKNADVTSQEIYYTYGTVKRDNSATKRSTSSVAIKPTTLATDTQYEVGIPCANGATIRVVGYCKADTSFYNGGGSNYTPPTATLSGLGATAVVYTSTSAANNAFEKFDISITNSSGNDGNFTLTLNANAKSVTTGTVYFDGVPTNSPFVTKARHYGFTFDQTLPQAVVNSSVSASEATAAAYTDFTVTGGTTQSNTALAASSTFQKLYDYTQAWSCLNLTYAVPFSAPVAGSLVALANLTTTGYSLTGTGSVAMGSYTLTSEFTVGGYAYTYTGGTYSQATSGSPAFSGGTITMPTLGAVTAAMTFTAASCTLNMKPSSASANYNCGAGTFSGTITITNTTGITCTLQLPTGTTVNNTTSGANLVTVVTPSVYQSVTVTGFTAGSRIWIKDVTSGNVLFNGTSSSGDTVVSGSTATWTDSTPASATRQIAVRVAYVSTVTAKAFVDVTDIGTCATSGSGKDITYIVAQTADTTYNSNAIDGSTVADVTFTDAATDLVVCNLAGGSTTYPRLYAAFVYWMFSSSGIDDDNTYIDAPDPANYLFTSMKIRNTNATPLTITGGYGRDATSGLVADIVDVTGSTGNIYPQPDHVVAYQTSGTYAITGDISTVLTSIGSVPAAVLTAAQSAPIHSDIRKVLGGTIDGDGSDANPWGPA